MITEKEIKEILLRYSTEFLGHETIDESSYYDYADDINELLVKKLTIPFVVGQSEQLNCVLCESIKEAKEVLNFPLQCGSCGYTHTI